MIFLGQLFSLVDTFYHRYLNRTVAILSSLIPILIILIIVFGLPARGTTGVVEVSAIHFTPAETAWLIKHPDINIGIMNGSSDGFSDGTVTVPSSSNNWFTAGFGGGLRYHIGERLGIRLQARLLLPMQFGGVGFGCGIGTGGGSCGAGVSTYTNIIQGDFTGGITLRLGDN